MSSKFHLTPKGQARQCSAKTPESCRYSQLAGETVEHYETKEEAQQAYEKTMNDKTTVKLNKRKSPKDNAKISTKELFNNIQLKPEYVDEEATKEAIIEVVEGNLIYDDSDFSESNFDVYGYEDSDDNDSYDDYDDFSDMKRDTTIDGIKAIDKKYLAKNILIMSAKKGYRGSEKEFDEAASRITDLVEKHNLHDTGNYELDVENGYYGEELKGVIIHNKTEIEDFVTDLQNLIKNS